MEIVEMSKSEFDDLPLERLWPHENEWAWLSDPSGRVVGVVVLDLASGLWGFSVCERDEYSVYCRTAFADDVRDGLTAKRKLVEAMQRR